MALAVLLELEVEALAVLLLAALVEDTVVSFDRVGVFSCSYSEPGGGYTGGAQGYPAYGGGFGGQGPSLDSSLSKLGC